MKNLFGDSKLFFEKLDGFRDRILFNFINKYWPREILPNHLTIVRIIIGIFLFVMLFYYQNNNGLVILSLFCLGALTDLLDGSVARVLNKKTKFGAIIDSAADRFLIIPIAVYSLFEQHGWLLFLIVISEIINALISLWAQLKGIFIESNIFGKVKMFLHSVVFAAIILFWPKPPHLFFIYLLWLSLILMTASIFLKFIDVKSLIKAKSFNDSKNI